MLPSGSGTSPSSVLVLLDDGDRGDRFPNRRNANARSFPRDTGLFDSSPGDSIPDAAEDTRDMLDWLPSGDGWPRVPYAKGL